MENVKSCSHSHVCVLADVTADLFASGKCLLETILPVTLRNPLLYFYIKQLDIQRVVHMLSEMFLILFIYSCISCQT